MDTVPVRPRPTPPGYRPKRFRTHWKKLIFWFFGSCLALIVIAVLFIQYDTGAAATFTDNVLRPLIGDTRVIALEKLLFNTKDKVAMLGNKTPDAPLANTGTAITTQNTTENPHALSSEKVTTQTTKPLANEGVWQALSLSSFPQPVMEQTFVHPDPDRNYALASLLQIDMSHFTLSAVAGTKEPAGAVGKPGPGVIPKSVQASGKLVAAFDGGFQYRDGQYGMIVGNTTYLPLKTGLATLIAHKDGRLEIIDYEGQAIPADATFVRQNCPPLIDNGVIGTQDEKNKKLWGRTLTSDIYTWRSGIGITAGGNLIFAVGNSLTPTTLAVALQSAGAVNAMQLDINPFWVRFNLFDYFKNGTYTSKPLVKNIQDGSKQYLNGYTKDFFYLTAN